MAKAQAPSNADRGQAPAPAPYQLSAALRIEAARHRLEAGTPHDESASHRDRAARERDRLAVERDGRAEARDRELIDFLDGEANLDSRGPYVEALRSRITTVCEGAATDRALAREDRERAACDREFAAIERAQATRERRAAGIDELTGARRRGVGLEELDREIDRARRTRTSLVAVFVDVDNLKTVNDVLGHGAGDRLLCSVVGGLKRQLRAYDLIVRLGGDEFLCVLPGVTADDARARFANLNAELCRASPQGSVSIGVAELHDRETQPELIEAADQDLLAARPRRRFSRTSPQSCH